MQKSFENIVTRESNAIKSFTDSIQEQFGLSEEQSLKAYQTLKDIKVVKVEHNIGQVKLMDGRFWQKDVLERAAGG